MDVRVSNLVEFWREFEPNQDSNLHPRDREFFPDQASIEDIYRVHLGLLPSPFLGDLSKADVFVVYLNPGFSPEDYEWESHPDFRAARINTIKQTPNRSVPVDMFEPAFRRHPGFKWWKLKLGGTMSNNLQPRLSSIELYPYHSEKYKRFPWHEQLPSFRAAVAYVRSNLVPRAEAGEICLVVARGAWALRPLPAETENIVIYGAGENQGAWLTPGSRGGQAIIRWLQSRPQGLASA